MASLVSQAAFYGGGILLYKNIHHEQRLSSEAYKVDSGWYWDGVHKLLGSEDVVRWSKWEQTLEGNATMRNNCCVS